MTFGTTSIARSICASLLNRPREKRRLRLASSPLGFIARNTCEASCEPVRQAEPAEQQIPCRSNKRSADEDSMPSNERLDVFGSRAAPAPLTDAPFTRFKHKLLKSITHGANVAFAFCEIFEAQAQPLFRDQQSTRRFPSRHGDHFLGLPPAINGLKRVCRLI